MSESTQHELSRVRPPRVQITYDVEIGDAIQMKELPFVAGILADLSGKPAEALPKVKDRKFVEIDRDNFDEVLEKACAPRLDFTVPYRLKEGEPNGTLKVELTFKTMEDFNPANVVKNIPELKELFDARQHLMDLLAKLDGNDKLDELLREVAENPASQETLKALTKPAENAEKSSKTPKTQAGGDTAPAKA